MSEPSIEERVRRRAYQLWEEAGRPHGRNDEFWERARTELQTEVLEEQDQTLEDIRKEHDERDT